MSPSPSIFLSHITRPHCFLRTVDKTYRKEWQVQWWVRCLRIWLQFAFINKKKYSVIIEHQLFMKYLTCLFSKWRTKMWKRGKIIWKYSLPCNTTVLRISLRKLEFKKNSCAGQVWPATYPEGKKENARKHFSSLSLSALGYISTCKWTLL